MRPVVLFSEEQALGTFVTRTLREAGFAVRWEMAPEAALDAAEKTHATVLVADARSDELLPGLISRWRERAQNAARVVIITRAGGSPHAALGDEVVSSPLAPRAIRAAVEKVSREENGG
jgi:DNA-binding response OmpR family regulator